MAEIEKTGVPSDTGINLYWWPKVSSPKGFEFQAEVSRRFGAKMFVQHGATFSNSESVIYAKAIYKPRMPEIKSLSALIDHDIAEFKGRDPKLKIVRAPFLPDGDGKLLQVLSFSPSGQGNWESVAYGEEGEFYLIFTISSQTSKGHEISFPAFKAMLQGYREKP
ncbi:MAG: hypothetical protein IPQ13_13775 [Holophagaceae bacterium]|nr:hypothetical protein [Holophagaceae bacterium]